MSIFPVILFIFFVALVLGLTFWLANKAKSEKGYFAAGGQIHWGVNGIAFAGDYLSAASFLGICGLIASHGYDGFLYSIGFLAGWIVALFIVAEPMKRLGKYTFADALDAKFDSRGIKLAAAISTLIVSMCYLIPQMVGAGALVRPLLGLSHSAGVLIVGGVVILIVATAGMASTTYVQFLKGGLLIIFSLVLTVALLLRGFSTEPDQGGRMDFYRFKSLPADVVGGEYIPRDETHVYESQHEVNGAIFVKLSKLRELGRDAEGNYTFQMRGITFPIAGYKEDIEAFMASPEDHEDIRGAVFAKHDGKPCIKTMAWWEMEKLEDGTVVLHERASEARSAAGRKFINAVPVRDDQQLQLGHASKIQGKSGAGVKTGPVGPFKFLAIMGDPETEVIRWVPAGNIEEEGFTIALFRPLPTAGNTLMRPGLKFKNKLDFISLMLALFFGTAALPHILIRYYTVPSEAAARKSTIVAIGAIGFFYILTMYMGLGAIVNGTFNPASSNMSAPLLARSFGMVIFSIISALAFATVLGTVSGLIIAASGAIAHDILDRFSGLKMNEKQKVNVGRLAAFAVGLIAIILGVIFQGMNVGFLVGWAFAVAASANLPAIIMLLFWKKTTAKGIVASICVGTVAAVGLILISPDMYQRYGLDPGSSILPFSNPGIMSIPLSFIVLVIVSLLTQKRSESPATST